MKRYGIYALLTAALIAFGCTTEEVLFDAEEQLVSDIKLVDDFLNTHDIAATQHASGFYYIVRNEGTRESIHNKCRWSFNLTVFYLDSTYSFSTIKDVEVARGFPEPYYDTYELYTCNAAFERPPALRALSGIIGIGGKVELFVPSTLAWGTEGFNRHVYPYTPGLERLIDIPSNTNVLITAELIEVE